MQAAAEKMKKKKSKAPIIIVLILLIAAAGVYAWFYLQMPIERGYGLEEFTRVPLNREGYNLIGNSPENLRAGGFMASQDGWIYFANFRDSGALYMCQEGGDSMVKLTDFPVANLNVMADSLIFTGLERCVISNYGWDFEVKFDSVSDLLEKIQPATDAIYGGPLYAIYGLDSNGELSFAAIDPQHTYFSPQLNADGLFASSLYDLENEDSQPLDYTEPVAEHVPIFTPVENAAQNTRDYSQPGVTPGFSWAPAGASPDDYVMYSPGDYKQSVVANLINNKVASIGSPGDYIIKSYIGGDLMYFELHGDSGAPGQIIRVDMKTVQPIDSLNGRDLYRSGNGDSGSGFVFINLDDSFIYEISPDENKIVPISRIPITGITVDQRGEISGEAFDNFLISRTMYYSGVKAWVMAVTQEITQQNGWYHYGEPSPDLLTHIPFPGIFEANGSYYHVGADGVWRSYGEPVEWLSVQSITPVAPIAAKEKFEPATSFNPAWISDKPDGTEDFGSEAEES